MLVTSRVSAPPITGRTGPAGVSASGRIRRLFGLRRQPEHTAGQGYVATRRRSLEYWSDAGDMDKLGRPGPQTST